MPRTFLLRTLGGGGQKLKNAENVMGSPKNALKNLVETPFEAQNVIGSPKNALKKVLAKTPFAQVGGEGAKDENGRNVIGSSSPLAPPHPLSDIATTVDAQYAIEIRIAPCS